MPWDLHVGHPACARRASLPDLNVLPDQLPTFAQKFREAATCSSERPIPPYCPHAARRPLRKRTTDAGEAIGFGHPRHGNRGHPRGRSIRHVGGSDHVFRHCQALSQLVLQRHDVWHVGATTSTDPQTRCNASRCRFAPQNNASATSSMSSSPTTDPSDASAKVRTLSLVPLSKALCVPSGGHLRQAGTWHSGCRAKTALDAVPNLGRADRIPPNFCAPTQLRRQQEMHLLLAVVAPRPEVLEAGHA